MTKLKNCILFIAVLYSINLNAQNLNNALPIYENGYWGLINLDGEVITKPKYTAIGDFENGFSKALNSNGKLLLINSSGKEIALQAFMDVNYLGDGFISVLSDSGWSIIDTLNIKYTQGAYNLIEYSSKYKCFIVDKDSLVGLLDTSDKIIQPIKYKSIELYDKYYIANSVDSTFIYSSTHQLVNKGQINGIEVFKYPFIIRKTDLNKIGLENHIFNLKIEPLFSDIKINNSWIEIEKSDSIVYINFSTGKVIGLPAKLQFYPIEGASISVVKNKEGFALFSDDKGLLTHLNHINFKYDSCLIFMQDSSNKWAAYNYKGKQILPYQFSDLSRKYKYIIATKKYKGLYSLQGKSIIREDYERFSFLGEIIKGYIGNGVNVFVVENDEVTSKQSFNNFKTIGFKEIVNTKTDSSQFNFGWFRLRVGMEDKYGFRSMDRELFQPPNFDDIVEYPKNDLAVSIYKKVLDQESLNFKYLNTKFSDYQIEGLHQNSTGKVLHKNYYSSFFKKDLVNDSISYCRVLSGTGSIRLLSKYDKGKVKGNYVYVDESSNGLARFCSMGFPYTTTYGADPLIVKRTYDIYEEADLFLKSEIAIPEAKLKRLFTAFRNAKWGFVDAEGNIAIQSKYSFVQRFKNNTAIFYLNDKWGVIDKFDKIVVENKYNHIKRVSSSNNDFFIVGIAHNSAGFINKNGKNIIANKFSNAEPFCNDRAVVKINNYYNWIDTLGNVINDVKYEAVSSFSNNRACFKLKKKWGLIDNIGNELTKPIYDQIYSCNTNATWAKIKSNSYILGRDGELKNKLPFNRVYQFDFNYTFAQIKGKRKYSLVHASGSIIKKNKYKKVEPFNKYAAVCAKRRKFGLIDSTARKIIPFKNKKVDSIYHNWYCITRNPKQKYLFSVSQNIKIDIDDSIKSKIIYSLNDSVIVVQYKKYQTLYHTPKNKSTDLLSLILSDLDVDSMPNEASEHTTSFKIVKSNSGFRYADTDNNFRFNTSFFRAKPFIENLAAVRLSRDHLWKNINVYGMFVSPNQYTMINQNSENGLSLVKFSHKYGLHSDKGKQILKPIFDQIYYLPNYNLFGVVIDNTLKYLRPDGTWL